MAEISPYEKEVRNMVREMTFMQKNQMQTRLSDEALEALAAWADRLYQRARSEQRRRARRRAAA